MELPGITSINKTEDLLLALAVSDTVDWLYYCSTLKFNSYGSTYIANIYLEFSPNFKEQVAVASVEESEQNGINMQMYYYLDNKTIFNFSGWVGFGKQNC